MMGEGNVFSLFTPGGGYPGQVQTRGGVPQGTYPPTKVGTLPQPGQDGSTQCTYPHPGRYPSPGQIRMGGGGTPSYLPPAKVGTLPPTGILFLKKCTRISPTLNPVSYDKHYYTNKIKSVQLQKTWSKLLEKTIKLLVVY